MFENKNTKSSNITAMWTNSGESIKNGQSKRFRGWALAGIEQYNAYYAAIKKDREENRDFDIALLRKFQEEHHGPDDVPVVYAPDGLPGVGPAHDLPWAANKAATATTSSAEKTSSAAGSNTSSDGYNSD